MRNAVISVLFFDGFRKRVVRRKPNAPKFSIFGLLVAESVEAAAVRAIPGDAVA